MKTLHELDGLRVARLDEMMQDVRFELALVVEATVVFQEAKHVL